MERKPDPEPYEANDVAIVAGGTALWLVALVVLALADVTGASVHGWWYVMCAVGAALGLLGVRTCLRRRDRLARG